MSDDTMTLELTRAEVAALASEPGDKAIARKARAALAAHRQTEWERRLAAPWKAVHGGNDTWFISVSDYATLAQLRPRYDGHDELRARVIATAPRALRALERLLEHWGFGTDEAQDALAEARAVLAEAGVPRGEE